MQSFFICGNIDWGKDKGLLKMSAYTLILFQLSYSSIVLSKKSQIVSGFETVKSLSVSPVFRVEEGSNNIT